MADASSTAPQAFSFPKQIAAVPKSRLWLIGLDLLPALCAAALPWSTSASSFFSALWFITIFLSLKPARIMATLRRPAAFLPLALLALALLGTLWASDSWATRLQGLSPVVKLLAIPLLLYQFQRSERGHWTFIAFLGSCALLMGVSWIDYLSHDALRLPMAKEPGVPVRNYIDQTQEFALCAFGLAPLLLMAIRKRQIWLAILCGALLVGFIANMAFVIVARTAFIYMPILAIIFTCRFLDPKLRNILLVAGAGLVVLAWFMSPYLQQRVQRSFNEYEIERETDLATSFGQRLFYWQSSIASIEQAPVFGLGTGSTKQVFDRAAEGKTGEWANRIRNPHNQTLYVAVQWGLFGCILLWAMWYFHLALFLELALVPWIGFVVVVQNVISSLLNSHLFDFHEGWLYVLGVGVAGGMVLAKNKSRALNGCPSAPPP